MIQTCCKVPKIGEVYLLALFHGGFHYLDANKTCFFPYQGALNAAEFGLFTHLDAKTTGWPSPDDAQGVPSPKLGGCTIQVG